jgi:hypothetical protein
LGQLAHEVLSRLSLKTGLLLHSSLTRWLIANSIELGICELFKWLFLGRANTFLQVGCKRQLKTMTLDLIMFVKSAEKFGMFAFEVLLI